MKKASQFYSEFASCHLNLRMAKIASTEMRKKFILTSIKVRKLSCMFTQHQNKLSEREKDYLRELVIIEGSGDLF